MCIENGCNYTEVLIFFALLYLNHHPVGTHGIVGTGQTLVLSGEGDKPLVPVPDHGHRA